MTPNNRSYVWILTAIAAIAFPSAGNAAEKPAAKPASDPYADVLHYKIDQSRAAAMAVEAEIRAAKPEQMPAIEARLLKVLESPQATSDAKQWACRQLREAGTEQSASAVGALLTDPQAATAARMALQSIRGAKVDAVLREALSKTQGPLKAGVAQTLGVRGDCQAVPLLAPLAGDKDAEVAEAALYALGHIGGDEALRAIRAAQPPEGLKRYRWHAILLCAERMAEARPADAAAVYKDVSQQCGDAVIKRAALRGLIACEKAKAAK